MPEGIYVRSEAILNRLRELSKQYGFKRGNSFGGKKGRKLKNYSREQRQANGRKYLAQKGQYVGWKNRFYKHGLKGQSLYNVWKSIRQRCNNPRDHSFKNYGAIGIKIWEPWKDPACFVFGILALLGPRPDGYSLDRINPWDGYFPWNVRWANRLTQKHNTREKVPNYASQSGDHWSAIYPVLAIRLTRCTIPKPDPTADRAKNPSQAQNGQVKEKFCAIVLPDPARVLLRYLFVGPRKLKRRGLHE